MGEREVELRREGGREMPDNKTVRAALHLSRDVRCSEGGGNLDG